LVWFGWTVGVSRLPSADIWYPKIRLNLFISSLTAIHFYGHGYSALPEVQYTQDLLRQQVEELLLSLGLSEKYPSFLLVGHSMGGLVACEFAAHNKSSVSSLVLFNCAGLPVKIASHKYASLSDCCNIQSANCPASCTCFKHLSDELLNSTGWYML
jgi:pimeloyl-ACP methyl ester carboxylesterase